MKLSIQSIQFIDKHKLSLNGSLKIGSSIIALDQNWLNDSMLKQFSGWPTQVLKAFAMQLSYPKLEFKGKQGTFLIQPEAGKTAQTLQVQIYQNTQMIAREEVGSVAFVACSNQLYAKLIKYLIECETSLSTVNDWAECISGQAVDTDFKIGTRVQTRLSERVKTQYEGVIFTQGFHSKKQAYFYQLLIQNTLYSKYYFAEDLNIIDTYSL